jgi:peptidoglycan/xylan/chitin deacetylase (PgdA/CDA1 family)
MKRHVLTLSFDDGFVDSFTRVAAIYEKFGLSACLNVIATGHLIDPATIDEWHAGFPKGDFALWNQLKARRHEVMPHGYRHANKARMPFEEAKDLILKCLDVFSKNLDGFDAKQAVFNFPYNASTPEIEAWLPTVVGAFRTGGGALQPLPGPNTVKVTSGGSGPGNCEDHLDQCVKDLLATESGWVVYNTHGLDQEGWGPIRASYLEERLAAWTQIPSLAILPTGAALRASASGAALPAPSQ